MPDDVTAGTDNTGTQPTALDTQPSTGTEQSGTQPTEQDSQPHSSTTTTTPDTTAQVEGEEQARTPTGEQKPSNPWDSPENPYYKRFNDTQSHAARLYQEKTQLAKQAQEYQERIARFEAQQKEAETKSKLLPFQKAHPEFSQTRDRLSKVAAFKTALSSFPDADDTAIKRLAQGMGVTAEDFKLEAQERDYRQRITEELQSDPEGFIQTRVETKIQEALQKYDEYLSSRVNVERLVNDPNNANLIEQFAPQMARIMDPQVPGREKAFDHARLLAENAALKAKLGKQVETVAHGEAHEAMQAAQPGRQRVRPNLAYPDEARRDAVAWLRKQDPNIPSETLARKAHQINDYFSTH